VATNPDQTTAILPAAFTIDATGAAQLWTNLTGPAARVGRTATFNINYGNTGTADALAVPLTFSVPAGYGLAGYFAATPPPSQPGQVAGDWSTAPIDILLPQSGVTNVSLLLPVVPAGFSGTLRIAITPPADSAATSILATAPSGKPFMTPDVDSGVIAQMASAAQAYSAANLGAAIPDSHLPALSQYAANQLSLAVDPAAPLSDPVWALSRLFTVWGNSTLTLPRLEPPTHRVRLTWNIPVSSVRILNIRISNIRTRAVAAVSVLF
jgi:hypothetical protein